MNIKPMPLLLAASAVVVVAAIGYGAWGPDPAPVVVEPQATAGAAPPAAYEPAGMPRFASGHVQGAGPVMVADAFGATLDASRLFELGFSGGLVIDKDTRATIEAVLNSMPEQPTEDDIQRLERTLREGLPREDAERAIGLFSAYRGYTADVGQQLAPMGIPKNLQEMNAMFDQADAIKRRHFDAATAQALFGSADRHARVTMEAMFVEQDASLTFEQKKARLDELRAQLPPDQRDLIAEPAAPDAAAQPAS